MFSDACITIVELRFTVLFHILAAECSYSVIFSKVQVIMTQQPLASGKVVEPFMEGNKILAEMAAALPLSGLVISRL